jgi:hypothetical protein
MAKARSLPARPSNNEVRHILLQYFYNRNRSATSARGKRGSAVKISDVKKELRTSQGLSQVEVQSNLTYLISQGWVEEQRIEKSFTTPRGAEVPSTTSYYQITAAGIDKIEGEGDFTMPKFHGIKIEATGQNVITLGDGNQINAQFSDLGTALVELRDAIARSSAPEAQKLSLVADIDTVQSQLAKPTPNKGIVAAAWEAIKGAAAIDGCVNFVEKVAGLVVGVIS